MEIGRNIEIFWFMEEKDSVLDNGHYNPINQGLNHSFIKMLFILLQPPTTIIVNNII